MRKQLIRWITEVTSIPLVSKITGVFAKSSASKIIIPFFANLYKINVSEAEFPLKDYSTLNAFFTRRLKSGARTIDIAPNSLISPVDARITAIGEIKSDTTLIVKGQTYRVSEILNHHTLTERFAGGNFIVLYLSPTDYHRIHAPVGGEWLANEHTPGAVLPVHDPALTHVKGVLRRNERLTTFIGSENGDVAVIKVGAMNVASIQYACTPGRSLQKGDELAYFEFGSTVVLFVSSVVVKQFTWNALLKEGGRVKMGEAIGSWN